MHCMLGIQAPQNFAERRCVMANDSQLQARSMWGSYGSVSTVLAPSAHSPHFASAIPATGRPGGGRGRCQRVLSNALIVTVSLKICPFPPGRSSGRSRTASTCAASCTGLSSTTSSGHSASTRSLGCSRGTRRWRPGSASSAPAASSSESCSRSVHLLGFALVRAALLHLMLHMRMDG